MNRTAIERTLFVLVLLAPIAAVSAGLRSRRSYDREHPEPPYPKWNDVDEDRKRREWKTHYNWNERGWNCELTAFGAVYGLGLASWLGLIVYKVTRQALSECIILFFLPLTLYFIVGYMVFIGYLFRYG